MLRKWGTLVFLLVATPLLAFGQNTGKLAGQVLDGETGDPLPGASVVLAGTQIGTISDIDGNYFIIGVPVGAYDVQSSFVGYQTRTVSGVEISAGYTREINFSLSPGVELDEIVVEYERPLIQKDAIGAPKVVTAEEIQNLPVRGAAAVAALQGGVVSTETSSNLYIRGGREQEVTYYVDGVRVVGGSLGVPTQAIAEQEMLIGSIPAKYGDAMSGIISLSTKTGADRFFGTFEVITSEVLDSYGYNNFSATLGGPIVRDKVNFFLSGEFTDRSDAGPRAVGWPQLNGTSSGFIPGDLDFLRQNPQAIEIMNDETGDIGYASFPGGIAAGTKYDDVVSQISIPEGWSLTDNRSPIGAANTFEGSMFSRDAERPNFGSQSWTLNGSLSFNPVDNVTLRLGGTYNDFDGTGSAYTYSIFNADRFQNQESSTKRFFGQLTHRVSNNTFWQFQGDWSSVDFVNYDPNFTSDVRDVLFYGDFDHPSNAVARRYFNYDPSDSTYNLAFQDGNLPDFRDIQNTFAPPGVEPLGYNKGVDERLGLSANLTTQIGVHQLEIGGEYDTRTGRRFSITGRDAFVPTARFFDDGNVEGGAAQAVTTWDQLPFNLISDGVFYYGYNYLGTAEAESQDIDRFATADGTDPSAYDMAPWQPKYYAGYISDKIEFRDIVLQIGARVDVYDANVPVLYDRFSLFPIVRAGDVGGAPTGIGDDFAVYFNPSDEVVGYRDLGGQFYDANGLTVANPLDIRNQGTPKATANRLTPEVFRDYEPQVTFMPRIGVSFPVTNRALFFASYDVVSQRPSENAFDTIAEWQESTEESTRNNNPGLKPETTTQYELGFRQRIGERAAIEISGFYRDIKNKISLRIVQNGFPNNYQWYENVDFGTVKGLEFEFDLRRTRNLQMTANYTMSFASGTGGDSGATGQIVWRQETNPFYPRFLTSLDFDQRHRVNVALDYRLGEGEGPRIGNSYPLANFGVNLVATVGSGFPYTRRTDFSPLYTGFNGFLLGEINGENQPSTALINLRVDRRFDIGSGRSLVAFLWIQNLLDTDNVQNVYSQTGLADDDGFLVGPEGRDLVAALSEAQSPQFGRAFSDYYRLAAKTPFNYGIPRQTRLGLRLVF